MFLDKVVKDLVDANVVGNKYGVEIEVELERGAERLQEDTWRTEHDGSLRGHGAEYVLRNPLSLKASQTAVHKLLKAIKKNNKVLDNGRAGVHVHVNVSDLTVRQLATFLTLAFAHESLLARYCGEFREGNLFCLRASDAGFIHRAVEDAYQRKSLGRFGTDRLRYAFINLKAIPQYGSVEFRGMRSDGDANAIINWLNILDALKQAAKRIASPEDVLNMLSDITPDGVVRECLGEYAGLLPRYPEWEADMFNNIRHLQHFAYTTDW